MKFAREFDYQRHGRRGTVLPPIYLAVLVLLKGMQTVAKLVQPLARCSRTGYRAKLSCLCWQC